jgi:polyferredoxin
MKRTQYRKIRVGAGLIFLFFTTVSFVSVGNRWTSFAKFQPGPLLVKLSGGFVLAVTVIVASLLIATFLFGRFFCAAICPLGVVQDIVITARKNDKTSVPNLSWLRYSVTVCAILMLVGGWALFFRIFEPFSRFGGMLSGLIGVLRETGDARLSYLIGGVLPLFALSSLAIWKKRFYCTALCPVGTILGLFAKFGVWQIRLNDSCVRCVLCQTSCPTSCIDIQNARVDNERCVRCMNCVSLCPNASIFLSGKPGKRDDKDVSLNRSRRDFLINGSIVALGVMTAWHVLGSSIRSLARKGKSAEELILPPGAMDAGKFMAGCTSCHLCALNCPTNVIKPAPYALGPVRLNFNHGACDYGCTKCNNVCPSGALKTLSLEEKQWLKIGEALFDASKCKVIKENKACDLCVQACPKGAIYTADGSNGLKIPDVLTYHCIGCGTCQSICPMLPKAITIAPIPQARMGASFSKKSIPKKGLHVNTDC